jgi:hypothetical protein
MYLKSEKFYKRKQPVNIDQRNKQKYASLIFYDIQSF